MPIYVYLCDDGHEVEAWQRINDPPLILCTFQLISDEHWNICCAKTHRIITAPSGFVFEPAGVYQPLPGMDPKTRRGREEKISKREYERRDRDLRARMLETRKRGPKLEPEERRRQTWV